MNVSALYSFYHASYHLLPTKICRQIKSQDSFVVRTILVKKFDTVFDAEKLQFELITPEPRGVGENLSKVVFKSVYCRWAANSLQKQVKKGSVRKPFGQDSEF